MTKKKEGEQNTWQSKQIKAILNFKVDMIHKDYDQIS